MIEGYAAATQLEPPSLLTDLFFNVLDFSDFREAGNQESHYIYMEADENGDKMRIL